ncbi:MAG: VWA domain-containing protein [Candidatus Omnitrophica bacterium]|nr:VWA domain-containing protein [Candidatus Omnitrophota bacterium]
MIFRNVEMFFLVPLVILFFFFYGIIQKSRKAGLKFSYGELFSEVRKSFRARLSSRLFYLRTIALIFMIFALARPQSPIEETEIISEGIDIVLCVDVSTSMLAEDFTINNYRYNRLYVVKEVVKDFIDARHADRIGMIVFAGRAYTVCPLTLDYDWLSENLERVTIGMIEDGTAIGSGISASLNRLKDTEAKGKVIILLTDGRNNAGKISPLTAAEVSKALGVKIYTIGAGTEGMAPYPFKDPYGRTSYKPVRIDIDENTLKEIADITGGKYFRATDTESLRAIYKEINKLETIPMKEKGYMEYKELFPFFLIPGILILLFEILLSETWLRRLP